MFSGENIRSLSPLLAKGKSFGLARRCNPSLMAKRDELISESGGVFKPRDHLMSFLLEEKRSGEKKIRT